MDADHNTGTISIDAKPPRETGGPWTVTLIFNTETFTDRVDVADAQDRARFCDAVAERWPAVACDEQRRHLESELERLATDGNNEGQRKQADKLIDLAQRDYRLGRTTADEPFAIPHDGPNIVRLLRGSGSLRSELAREYFRTHDTAASSTALADAMLALEGHALEADPEPVHLRLARHEGRIVLDLGDTSGRCVIIGADGWEIADRSPVLFRRSELNAALPEPTRGGSLDDLRALLNVAPDAWPLALGWLVASLIPDIQHPVLLLGGEHGTGKSTAALMLADLVDPSPATLQTPPKHHEQWALTAWASWIIAIDNVTAISGWLSDALCRAVSGDGFVRRRLYSDNNLSVISFSRAIILTSIDPGALRGDLGDRILLLDLETIDTRSRRSDTELKARYCQIRPGVLGALLDLVVKVLNALPKAEVNDLPRLADFGRVLAALDVVLETDALATYLAQSDRVALDVIESDPFGAALAQFMLDHAEWRGSAQALLDAVTPEGRLPKGWPMSARSAAGRLRRLTPALRSVGIELTVPAPTDKTRTYILQRAQGVHDPTAPTAQQPETAPPDPVESSEPWAVDDGQPPDRPSDRPNENGVPDAAKADPGRSGGSGDPSPLPLVDRYRTDEGEPREVFGIGVRDMSTLLNDLCSRRVALRRDGDKLLIDAPEGAVTPGLAQRLRDAKADLVKALRNADEATAHDRADDIFGAVTTHATTFWPPDAATWSDDARDHFLERLGVADELDQPTDPTSPAWETAAAEARRVQAGIPNELWSNEQGLIDEALSAFAGMDFRYKNHTDSN
jgi:hypothetical protein